MPGSKRNHRAPKQGLGRSALSAASLPALAAALVLPVAVTHPSDSAPDTRTNASAIRPVAATTARPRLRFTLGTFNVLGSNHTGPHGDDDPSWPSARWRTPREAAYIKAHGADIVGLQEAKPDQLRGLTSRLGWHAFPGRRLGKKNTDNSIIYNPAKWQFVSGTHFNIVFMHGPRPQTVLRLRDRASGRQAYFINMHTSAGHGSHNTATRHAGMAKAVHYINRLRRKGLPIFLTGDMNDREQFRHRVLRPARLKAPIDSKWSKRGKQYGGSWLAVDWIASSYGVSWRNYWVSVPQRHHVSDHYFISAVATVPAG